ncbi:hypothetical protein LOTGIDRAFT_168524 [Lottia gigantea]|uniref:Uncharacterized protein n=1 Tax=Lottia gigantea TaxID=225164 RepID=V3ZQ76_LOTGI|nr:hypothetical protein LOTGIDRAFT_168524 [Lottia gigantea]ESO84660.1 hypothetical protein LOTGIDRAFT_168524 [Lottia gigantea]
MDQQVLLPKLNNPRLKEVGKQRNLCHKRLTITNDKLKKIHLKLDHCLQRESEVENYSYWKRSMTYKKSLLEHKGLQVCLNRRRTKSLMSPTFQNGVYNGMKIDDMKLDVRNVIMENHPRTKRLREVENTKKLWKLNGNIVDYNKSLQTLDAIMKRQRNVLPAIIVQKAPSPPVGNNNISSVHDKPQHLLVLPPINSTRSLVR